jgi:hypothetical protein
MASTVDIRLATAADATLLGETLALAMHDGAPGSLALHRGGAAGPGSAPGRLLGPHAARAAIIQRLIAERHPALPDGPNMWAMWRSPRR